MDVFKSIGKNIFIYDVNSLYPYIMSIKDIPVGKPVLSYDKKLDNYFGFIYCRIRTPNVLDKPVLPFRNDHGLLYNPLGNWEGMYFSEELKESVYKYNYNIEILYGYKFERSKVPFKEFIIKYYNLRNAAKSEGLNSKALTCKLLMNSLYGRYGMKDIKDVVKLVSPSEAEFIHLYHDVSFNIPLSDNLEYIKYSSQLNDMYYDLKGLDAYINYMNNLDNNNKGVNTSLPIAMAITSYARIYMNEFINNKDYNVYSTDTDSIAIDKPLPDQLVGNKLGQFKLEHKALNAIFLSPKLYLIQLDNGDTIIKARSLGGKSLTMDDFNTMSYGLNISKYIDKFVSNMKDGGSVSLNHSPLELSPFNLKRQPHYATNGIISHTTPLRVHNGIIEPAIINIAKSLIPYKN